MFFGWIHATEKPIRGVWGGDCSPKLQFFLVTGLLKAFLHHADFGKKLLHPGKSLLAGERK